MMNFQIFQQLQRMNGLQVFEERYSCYSMAVSGRAHLEEGDKILLPPSALDTLARMNVEYPMLFEITNLSQGKKTHCGVLEFSAEEGRCYIPFWMMQNLLIGEGSLINIKNVSLQKAQFVKFRAQSVDFLEISNPRAVLEKLLRKFTCVTVGDQICIPYLGKNYFLEIREVVPDGAASIIETDCNVDFDEPVGYKESKYAQQEAKSKTATPSASPQTVVRELQKAKEEVSLAADEKKFVPFKGSGHRIDGKPSSSVREFKPDSISSSKNSSATSSPVPNTIGGGNQSGSESSTSQPRQSLIGNKYSKKKSAVTAFQGTGYSLSK